MAQVTIGWLTDSQTCETFGVLINMGLVIDCAQPGILGKGYKRVSFVVSRKHVFCVYNDV